MTTTSLPDPVRGTVAPSTPNDSHGDTVTHPIGTDIADAMFTVALRATEEMVRNAAEASMPKSKFLPKFELARWDVEEMAACGVLFADAVRAVNAEKPKVRRVA